MKEPYDPVSYLEWNARRRPHASAVWDGREIVFEELLIQVRNFQRSLAGQGVRRGDVVGVRLPNVWQYVALELAIPALGAVILPMPMGIGDHELRWLNEKTQPVLTLTTADLDGARAGLEKATSWPRAANSRAIGNERVIRPRSFVGRVVSRSFTSRAPPGSSLA